MKNKISLLAAILLLPTNLLAQSGSSDVSNAIKTEAELQSGNYSDVLNSFFQLGLKDLIGDDRSFQFKANLYAIRLKADSSLKIDTNYRKAWFSRKFNFDVSLKLDSNYKFNGFSGGFTYALVNKRDVMMKNIVVKGEQDFIEIKDSMDIRILNDNALTLIRKQEIGDSLNAAFEIGRASCRERV